MNDMLTGATVSAIITAVVVVTMLAAERRWACCCRSFHRRTGNHVIDCPRYRGDR